MNSKKQGGHPVKPLGVPDQLPSEMQDFQVMSTARKVQSPNPPPFQHINQNAVFGMPPEQQWPSNKNKDLIVQDAVLSQKSAKNLGQQAKNRSNRIAVEKASNRQGQNWFNEPLPTSDYADETPMKQGGAILNTDISTLKKEQKGSGDKYTSREKLEASGELRQPSQYTSMQEDSALKPVEHVNRYPIVNSNENVRIDQLLSSTNRDDTVDTQHMNITENERYQDTATDVVRAPSNTTQTRVKQYTGHGFPRKVPTPVNNAGKTHNIGNNTNLEEVVTNSTDDRLQQDVRFMNQIGEELGLLSYPLTGTPQMLSPKDTNVTEQSARGTVYKLDIKGLQDLKRPFKQNKLQIRLDQLRKKRSKRRKGDNLSIQNSKMENTTPQSGQPSIQQSLMQSSRINADEFNQHVNKRFAKSFGTYSNDQKRKVKVPAKILIQNSQEEQQDPEKSRMAKHANTAQSYTVHANPNNQYRNVSSFLDEKGHANVHSPSSVQSKNRARMMHGGHDKLFGQFVQRIQGQQTVPTIVVGQVLKRISQQQGWEQHIHQHKRNKSLVPSLGSGQWNQVTSFEDSETKKYAVSLGNDTHLRNKFQEYALTDVQRVNAQIKNFTNPPIITTPPFQQSPSLYNELPQTPMNMNQIRAKKLIDQRSASRQKDYEKRTATVSKDVAPSNFTVDAVGSGDHKRGGFGPNSVMYNLKQKKLVTETENKTVETTMELMDGLAALRKKNTRNSTHQLTRRQNFMNNHKLAQLHNSVQDNQSVAGTTNNVTHVTDYHTAFTPNKPQIYGGYPNQLFYTSKNVNFTKFQTASQSRNSMIKVSSPDHEQRQPARIHKSQGKQRKPVSLHLQKLSHSGQIDVADGVQSSQLALAILNPSSVYTGYLEPSGVPGAAGGKQPRLVFTPQNNQYPPNKGQALRSLSKYQQQHMKQHQSSNLRHPGNEIDQLTAMGIQYKTQAPRATALDIDRRPSQEAKAIEAIPSKEENTKIVINMPHSVQRPPKAVHNLGLELLGKVPLDAQDSILHSQKTEFAQMESAKLPGTQHNSISQQQVTFRATEQSLNIPTQGRLIETQIDSIDNTKSHAQEKSPNTIKLSHAFMKLNQIKINIS